MPCADNRCCRRTPPHFLTFRHQLTLSAFMCPGVGVDPTVWHVGRGGSSISLTGVRNLINEQSTVGGVRGGGCFWIAKVFYPNLRHIEIPIWSRRRDPISGAEKSSCWSERLNGSHFGALHVYVSLNRNTLKIIHRLRFFSTKVGHNIIMNV